MEPFHPAPPQAQEGGMAKAAPDAAGSGGSKPLVVLRVKRRRPPPPANDGEAATAAAANDDGGAPDRIQLALPYAPAGGSKRRRRMGKEEELALVERLDSAVSLHNNFLGGGCATNDIGGEGLAATPTRKGAGNNPYDPENNTEATDPNSGLLGNDGGPLRRRGAPPSAASGGNAPDAASGGDPSSSSADKETPAPPTKPKRTVIFRKITDLKRRLEDAPDEVQEGKPSWAATDSSGAVSAPTAPQTAPSATPPRARWASLGEERSKWLRVVDVSLKEEEDQVSSIASSAAGSGGSLGSGARVRRMRPRPSDEDEGNGEGNGESGEGGGRKKRRKVGWVVERSRTVRESDFLREGPAAADAGGTNNDNSNLDKLYLSSLRLLEHSLSALHTQGGGTVYPHLSVIKRDPRIGYVGNTPSGRLLVNHPLGAESHLNPYEEGRGRTVLHYAALWGDLAGTTEALAMGADPTVFDAQGNTPAGLARKGGHRDVVAALVAAEKTAVADKNIRESNGDEYYYEVYCLEDAGDFATGEASSGDGISAYMEEKKDDEPRFLRPKDDANTDSIPDLTRSSVLSEDDDSSGNHRGQCALIELQKGFGYWNERGELVLEADRGGRRPLGGEEKPSTDDDDDRFVRRFYNDHLDDDASMGEEEEHDSNDEGYDGNDYPEDESVKYPSSLGLDSDYEDYRDADAYGRDGRSDDESDGGWNVDFRKRAVPEFDFDGDYALKDYGYGG